MENSKNKILVVSDNQDLSIFLNNTIVNDKQCKNLNIDYCYTSYNSNPQPMIEIGAKEINMKDESTIDEIIKKYSLVFSLHCKQIFPKKLVENICCINFHPGLNPYNRGWYPQVFSILNGLPIGATIHLMDAEVDHGKIIAQQEVSIEISDTSLEVYNKVLAAEKNLITHNIINIIKGNFTAMPLIDEGNYNGIKDYRELCKLDLNSKGTLREHLNLLRATTHGDFNNAYFIDEQGSKYFIKINIEKFEL